MTCFNRDLLFIHVPKTGGVSVKQYLVENLYGTRGAPQEFPLGHIRAQDVEMYCGVPVCSFKVVLAVLRDPYEQQLSQWLFFRHCYIRGGRHVFHRVAIEHDRLETWMADLDGQFEQWYLNDLDYGGSYWRNVYAGDDWRGLYHWWLSVDGTLPENLQLVRFEDIAAAVPRIVSGVTGLEPGEFRHKNRGFATKHTDEYYTPAARELVEDRFAYEFGNGWFERHNPTAPHLRFKTQKQVTDQDK